jgi:HEAT repeat protein
MTKPILLSDDQMRHFIAHGYLCLKSNLPDDFHRHIYNRVDALTEALPPRGPGNNLLPTVPELSDLFTDPAIAGALQSVLGQDYVMHPHRALHNNPPGSDAQVSHKDSYWGYTQRVRNHRLRWAMIMYVPQDTPAERGPTGVIPGSQFQTQRPDESIMHEVAAALPAGGFLLIHYDIWHRKMKNLTDQKRYMMKFEFIRMAEPAAPSWNHRDPSWHLEERPGVDLTPVWRRQWAWLRHADPQGELPREAMEELLARLRAGREPDAIAAAYALADGGTAAVAPLVDVVRADDADESLVNRVSIDGSEADRGGAGRNATHALVEIGAPALPALLDLLATGRARARILASFALGEIASSDDAVVTALARATCDADVAVRVNAVEALGLKRGHRHAVPALAAALRDADPHVRFSAALSLAQAGPAAAAAVPALQAALTDDNRYVPGYAVEALERVNSPQALAALIPFLKRARWCPVTTPASTF